MEASGGSSPFCSNSASLREEMHRLRHECASKYLEVREDVGEEGLPLPDRDAVLAFLQAIEADEGRAPPGSQKFLRDFGSRIYALTIRLGEELRSEERARAEAAAAAARAREEANAARAAAEGAAGDAMTQRVRELLPLWRPEAANSQQRLLEHLALKAEAQERCLLSLAERMAAQAEAGEERVQAAIDAFERRMTAMEGKLSAAVAAMAAPVKLIERRMIALEGKLSAAVAAMTAPIKLREAHPGAAGAQALLAAGHTPMALLSAGFQLKELREGGCQASLLLLMGCSERALKDCGYSAAALMAAGADMAKAGFTVRELLAGGMRVPALLNLGARPGLLLEAGVPIQEVVAGGYTKRELKEDGIGVAQLLKWGCDEDAVLSAGFSRVRLRTFIHAYSPFSLFLASTHGSFQAELEQVIKALPNLSTSYPTPSSSEYRPEAVAKAGSTTTTYGSFPSPVPSYYPLAGCTYAPRSSGY